MKKILALVLVFSLIFVTVTTVSAEGTIGADAQACVTLGMIKGPTGVVDAAYTATPPTRLQSAIMFLRLKGLEQDALEFTGTDNFIDANTVKWDGGRAVMAYLKAHPALGWIGDNGRFSPDSLMTAQAYYKVLLQALGYVQDTNGTSGDFSWANTISFASTKGLMKVAAVTHFTVNDMATATIEALKGTVKGDTKTLVTTLIESGKLQAATATAAGVYTVPVNAVLAVDKVEVLNLVQLNITFNKAVDQVSAENIENYIIEDHVIKSAVLQANDKTVLLTLDADNEAVDQTAFEQEEEFTLEIDGIVPTDKTAILEDYQTSTLIAKDIIIPFPEKIELISPTKVLVTFNEPINDTAAASVKINDSEYQASVGEADGSDHVIVTLDDVLNVGDYTFKLVGAKDFAGYASWSQTFTLKYRKVTTPPTAQVVSGNQTKVVIQFNRPVTDESDEALDGSYFYHSITSYHPTVTTDDMETYILDFSSNPLPEGKVKVVIDYNANSSVITDEWGNEMTSNAEFTVSIAADKTKPVAKEITVVDEQTVTLNFSEALNFDTAVDLSNYVVKDKNSSTIDIDDIDYAENVSKDEYIVTLKFDDKLNGSYTVQVKNIKDTAATANVLTTISLPFVVADVSGIDLTAVTAIAVDGTGSSPDYIYMTFPEDMTTDGQYGVLNKENYLLTDNAGATFNALAAADTIVITNASNKIKIALKDNTDYNVSDSDFKISIARMADKAGNKSKLFAAIITPLEDAAIEATDFVVVDTKTVEVTFDGILKTVSTSGFKVSKDGGTAANPAAAAFVYKDTDNDKADETVVSLTLKSAQQLTDSDAEGMLEVSIVKNTLKSETGLYCDESLDNPVSDGIAPNITVIEQTGTDEIRIRFDEDISITNAGIASTDLVLRDKNSNLLVPGVDYSVSAGSSSLIISLIGDFEGYTGRLTIDTKDTVTYIFDADGEHAKIKAYGTPKALTIE